MSDRERWIVYPLLFLALAVGLRDKLTQTVRADRVECRALVLHDERQKPLLMLVPAALAESRSEESPAEGVLLLDGAGRELARLGPITRCRAVVSEKIASEKLVVEGPAQCRKLLVVDRRGKPLTVITANQWGGLLQIRDREQTLALDLGHYGTDRLSGLLAETADGRFTNLVNALTQRPQPKPEPPEPSE
jgi:hypothetical protein